MSRLSAYTSRALLILAIITASLWIRSLWVTHTIQWRYTVASFLALDSRPGSIVLRAGHVSDSARISQGGPKLLFHSTNIRSNNDISRAIGRIGIRTFTQPSFTMTVLVLPDWLLLGGFLAFPFWRFLGQATPPAPSPASPANLMENGSPDWATFQGDVECPLCEYNLRGITLPRCPECGYQFFWADLLDPTRKIHPWLFEQARHLLLRSLFKTLTRNFRPNRFWKTLNPAQPPNPRRLVLYFTIVLLFGLSPALVSSSVEPSAIAWPPAAWTWTDRILSTMERYHRPIVYLSVVMAFYPPLTALSLMIFQQSMRRAKIRSRHVMRCAIYSGDVILWNALWQFLAILIVTAVLGPFLQLEALFALGILTTIILMTLRLASAYKHYMKFPHALPTAILSQVVVLLTIAVCSIPLFFNMFLY